MMGVVHFGTYDTKVAQLEIMVAVFIVDCFPKKLDLIPPTSCNNKQTP
jgi:hypothetical protein